MNRNVLASAFLIAVPLLAQPPASRSAGPGQKFYENNCSVCHGADGAGGELAPSIVMRLPNRSDAELAALIHSGIPARGMPAFNLPAQDTNDLVAYLRTFRVPRFGLAPVRKKVETTDGQTIEGTVIGESSLDLSLRTDDSRIHLFRTTTGDRYRPVTSQTDWPTYNGDPSGNRYTQLSQIDEVEHSATRPEWMFPTAECSSDREHARGGRRHYVRIQRQRMLRARRRQRPHDLALPARPHQRIGGERGQRIQSRRGVDAGDRIFMLTDNAHLLALNRFTGELLWETEMADWHLNYNGRPRRWWSAIW